MRIIRNKFANFQKKCYDSISEENIKDGVRK